MASSLQSRIFRFGVYEADVATGELRKSGARLRLQEQPFQVLLCLLERPGEIVTRDELRQRLWPTDTFVDFDHSLNTIVNKLREALGDSASNPRFIETLARRGYRFLAPVERVGAIAGNNVIKPVVGSSKASTLLTHVDELPQVHRGFVRVLFFLIQSMYLIFYVVALARLSPIEDLLERVLGRPGWITATLVVTAIVGIPIRLYLLSGISFDVTGLSQKFRRLFVPILTLDGVWALSPCLLIPQIGFGLALAAVAALIYVPFAQRTLLLMSDRVRRDY
jgi:cholera toxin transcriptional activator